MRWMLVSVKSSGTICHHGQVCHRLSFSYEWAGMSQCGEGFAVLSRDRIILYNADGRLSRERVFPKVGTPILVDGVGADVERVLGDIHRVE